MAITWLLIDIRLFPVHGAMLLGVATHRSAYDYFMLLLLLPVTVFIREQIPLGLHSDLEDFLVALSVFLSVNILQ